MRRFIILFVVITFLFSSIPPAYGYKLIPAFLCELGLRFYQMGKLNLALQRFQRALVINPNYEPALRYIDIIQRELAGYPQISEPPTSMPPLKKPVITRPPIKEEFIIEEPTIIKPREEILLPKLERKTIPFQPEGEILPPQLKGEPTLLQPDEVHEFIELAIKNNQPAQIAREEIKLAQLKIKESERNLLPALKLGSLYSEGEVEDLYEYDEKEVKLQLDQPIYYGGRLRDTLDQSKVNLEITKGNYDRLRIDVAHKAEVAYYNLVASRMNLKIQEVIRQEAKGILEIVQKQFDAEVVTPLELTSTQSRYKQILFQLDSTKQDMAMAELTFMQVLNVLKPPLIAQEELTISQLNINVEQCLEAGLINRPEIYLSELLVQFNDYGQKIEESKNKFTVDLTTSYGYYEGAYRTEPTRSSETWYIGFKATKPWGGSTFNTQAVTEDAGPHYGEKTRTKVHTVSADFNILDNLARLSDKKKAEIELQRAVSDLNETTKTINSEIKDAYLNYQKALLQANTAQSEMEFRQNEVEVLRVRAQVGETEFSNIMEALVNLSKAQAAYTQALANYHISLANLKKAAGYGIKI